MKAHPRKQIASFAFAILLSLGFGARTDAASDVGAADPIGWVVNTTSDAADSTPGDGICDSAAAPGQQCTLRAAIQELNALDIADPGVLTITFDIPDAGPQVIQLTGALPDLSRSVKIMNDSGKSITVRRDTGGDYRIFYVAAGQEVTIAGLRLANGLASPADPHGNSGGAILNNGSLVLRKMWIHGNSTAKNEAGGLGGGVRSSGTLTVIASTFSENAGSYGGALSFNGTAALTNSTFSNNSADQPGLAIFYEGVSSANLTITGCTFAHHTGPTTVIASSFGGVLRNTIVADNNSTNTYDVHGVQSGGYNLIEKDEPGSGVQPKATDIIGVDAHLGPLEDNGGPTPTHKLLGGSPAIDKGKNFAQDENGDSIPVDQRGLPRPVDEPGYPNSVAGSDIGALEVQPAADVSQPTVRIEQALSQSNPTSAATIKFIAEFSEAVTGFNTSDVILSGSAGATTVNVVKMSATNYRINVTGMNHNGTVTVKVPQDVAFDAHGDGNAPSRGASTVIYSVSDEKAEFVVNSRADTDDGACTARGQGSGNQDCTLREAINAANTDLGPETITFGPDVTQAARPTIALQRGSPAILTPMTISGPSAGHPGAGRLEIKRSAVSGTPPFRILSIAHGASAVISGLTFSNGDARDSLFHGGAILNKGALTVLACRFLHNVTEVSPGGPAIGGAIASNGPLTVRDSTFADNVGTYGGAIGMFSGKLSIAGTTFVRNHALRGGAIGASGGLKIVNSTFSGNSAEDEGGAVRASEGSTVVVANCTFSGNTAPEGSSLRLQDALCTVGNTIFATESSANSIKLAGGAEFHSAGYNLSSDAAGGNNGTSPGGLLNNTGDQRNTAPKLRPLANKGGPTLTHAPANDSPAIDRGKDLARSKNGQPLGRDQRGEPRPVRFDQSIDKPEGGDGSDIGAVELAKP